jgi:hypothetical protein
MEISKFLIFMNFLSFILIFAKLEGDPRGGGVRCGLKFSGLSPAHY